MAMHINGPAIVGARAKPAIYRQNIDAIRMDRSMERSAPWYDALRIVKGVAAFSIFWPIALSGDARSITTVTSDDIEALKSAAVVAWRALDETLGDTRLQLTPGARAELENCHAKLTNALLRFDPCPIA